jgi:ubiquinone/menaquinone biosynthesis C-methylase UbiE
MSTFYNWKTPDVTETRVMETLCSTNDPMIIQKLYIDIINKLCNMKKKPNGNIDVEDNEIFKYLQLKMTYANSWNKQKIYQVCSSSKYKHITELIYSIRKKSNRVTNKKIKEQFKIATIETNGKVLDVGCLDENLTRWVCLKLDQGFLKDQIFEQHGIDVSSWSEHIKDENDFVKFVQVKNEYSRYPYPDNNFFMITCFQVLHHIENPTFIISEMYRVIATGGYVIIKEHDVTDSNVAGLCYISHMIRKYIVDGGGMVTKFPKMKCWFKNRHTWDQLFNTVGFNIIAHYYQPNNTLGTYYTLLQK